MVITDSGECLGSFGMVGDFYCHFVAWLYAHHDGDAEAMRGDWERCLRGSWSGCGQLLLAGCLPGIADYLRQLRSWRRDGVLDAVVMYTSAVTTAGQRKPLPSLRRPCPGWLGYVRRFLLPCIEAAAEGRPCTTRCCTATTYRPQ